MEDINYISEFNNAKIISCTSQVKSCPSSNLLSSEKGSIWLSETGTPQSITISLQELKEKPPISFKIFGIYCWHAYNTNPKLIEVLFSSDGRNYTSFGKFNITLKAGIQYFELNNEVETDEYYFMRIIVKENFGGNKIYINQLFLFDEISQLEKKLSNESNKNANFITIEDRSEDLTPERPETVTESEISKTESIYKAKNSNNNGGKNQNERNTLNQNSRKYDDNYKIESLSQTSRKKKENIPEKIIEDEGHFEENIDFEDIPSHNQEPSSKGIISKNNSDFKKVKTLDDQIKEMQNNLIKLKNDQFVNQEKNYFGLKIEPFSTQKSLNVDVLNSRSFLNVNPKQVLINESSTPTKLNELLISHENKDNISNRIDQLENKLNKIETELSKITVNFERLLDNVNKIFEFQNNFKEVNMNFLLEECKKFINVSLNKAKEEKIIDIHETPNLKKKHQSYIDENYLNPINNMNFSTITKKDPMKMTISNSPNRESVKDELYSVLDVKLENLVNNLEKRIYSNFLKPSLQNIEKKLSLNIEDLKNKVNSVNLTTLNSVRSSFEPIQNKQQNHYTPQHYNRVDLENKFNSRNLNISQDNNIRSLAEKLHEKLNEKEKKLNELQIQTNSIIQTKRIFTPIKKYT